MTTTTSLTSVLLSIVGFIILDGIWLGLVMKDFYRTQLLPIGRIVNGTFAPVWSAAALVYVLLGVGVAVFVLPRVNGVGSAAALRALFGLVVYGVYDLTNLSTLTDWPVRLTIADMAWGAVACAAVSAAVFSFSSR